MVAFGVWRIEPVASVAIPLPRALIRSGRGLISFRHRGLGHQGRRPLSAACTQTSVGLKTGL